MAKKYAVDDVVDETVAEEQVTPPQKPMWKMPRPRRGQAITYYHRSIVNERNADIGFVSAVHEASIDIHYRGQGYKDCYHKDDPRLKANPDLAAEIFGLWEFTNEAKELEERLERIERALGINNE